MFNVSQERLTALVGETSDDPLERVAIAAALARADWLVDHFVESARAAHRSWDSIADALGRIAADDEAESAGQRDVEGSPPNAVVVHTGKYHALWAHLRNCPDPTRPMTFGEIETVLGFQLPPSSRRHLPHWYGYEGSAVARAIIDAGWKAQNVDLGRGTVTFVRVAGP